MPDLHPVQRKAYSQTHKTCFEQLRVAESHYTDDIDDPFNRYCVDLCLASTLCNRKHTVTPQHVAVAAQGGYVPLCRWHQRPSLKALCRFVPGLHPVQQNAYSQTPNTLFWQLMTTNSNCADVISDLLKRHSVDLCMTSTLHNRQHKSALDLRPVHKKMYSLDNGIELPYLSWQCMGSCECLC